MADEALREVIRQLQSPIPELTTLLSLLAAPLDKLHILPPCYRKYNLNPLPDGIISIPKHFPQIHRALLVHVIPTWGSTLAAENAVPLLEQYFCPDIFSFSSPAAGEIALLAYSSILSVRLTQESIQLLARLSKEYPIDRLHFVIFSQTSIPSIKAFATWEDCVRSLVAVPAKVANALEGKFSIPVHLEHATYFNNMSVRCEVLTHSLSLKPSKS